MIIGNDETYEKITSELLLKKLESDKDVVAVTSAMFSSIGFDIHKRECAENQFIDVGIAEEHTVHCYLE